MNIFNGIKERLSFKLKVNLLKNDNIVKALLLMDDDESNSDSREEKFDFDQLRLFWANLVGTHTSRCER